MEQAHSGSSCNGSAESLGSVQPLLDLEAACGAGSGMARLLCLPSSGLVLDAWESLLRDARVRFSSCRLTLCPRLTPASSLHSGTEYPPAAEHHHLHPDRPVPAARAGLRGCFQDGQETRGIVSTVGM